MNYGMAIWKPSYFFKVHFFREVRIEYHVFESVEPSQHEKVVYPITNVVPGGKAPVEGKKVGNRKNRHVAAFQYCWMEICEALVSQEDAIEVVGFQKFEKRLSKNVKNSSCER